MSIITGTDRLSVALRQCDEQMRREKCKDCGLPLNGLYGVHHQTDAQMGRRASGLCVCSPDRECACGCGRSLMAWPKRKVHPDCAQRLRNERLTAWRDEHRDEVNEAHRRYRATKKAKRR